MKFSFRYTFYHMSATFKRFENTTLTSNLQCLIIWIFLLKFNMEGNGGESEFDFLRFFCMNYLKSVKQVQLPILTIYNLEDLFLYIKR